ncbi:hypothetical protein ACWC5I_17340 [Kitasatospora sp. NPDC001574]
MVLELMGAGSAQYERTACRQRRLSMCAPCLDTRVTDVCHAVPSWQHRRCDDSEAITGRAFTGAIPGFLLQCCAKIAFAISLYSGIRAHWATLAPVIKAFRLAGAGLNNPAHARATWRESSGQPDTDLEARA